MYCSRNQFFTLICAWWSIACVVADDHGVVFLYPTDDLTTINYLDTVNVTYTSLFPEPQLWIFCQNISDVTAPIITEFHVGVTAYNGSAPVNFKWLGGSPCWFDLKPNASAGYGANSPHFTVDQNKRATPITLGSEESTSTLTTTTSISTPTTTLDNSDSNDVTTTATTATSIPTASSDASTTSTSNSTTSTPAKSTGGLSGGTKAGIGIGIALVALVALAAGFFFWRRKQAKKPEKAEVDGSMMDYSKAHAQEPVAFEMYAPENQYEMPGTRPVGELSSDGQGRTHSTT